MPTELVLSCKKEHLQMDLKQFLLNKCEFIKLGASSLLIFFILSSNIVLEPSQGFGLSPLSNTLYSSASLGI